MQAAHREGVARCQVGSQAFGLWAMHCIWPAAHLLPVAYRCCCLARLCFALLLMCWRLESTCLISPCLHLGNNSRNRHGSFLLTISQKLQASSHSLHKKERQAKDVNLILNMLCSVPQ